MAVDTPARGLTPPEVARLLRVSPDKVLLWIRQGLLGAVNTSSRACGRPRYVVLPRHLDEFVNAKAASTDKRTQRRKKRSKQVDYYPE
jgi:hypothetical protein